MRNEDISLYLEHTLLKQGTTLNDIKKDVDFSVDASIPTIVVPPFLVESTKEYLMKLGSKISLCSVAGFPLGYNTYNSKLYEVSDLIISGADEIDIVINNSLLKRGDFKEIEYELKNFRSAAKEKILKVIIETSLLKLNEIGKITETLIECGVDYVKTSTGFVGDGAKAEHIRFIKDNFKHDIKIKASGGIKTRDDALIMIDAGADRIGTSSSKIILG